MTGRGGLRVEEDALGTGAGVADMEWDIRMRGFCVAMGCLPTLGSGCMHGSDGSGACCSEELVGVEECRREDSSWRAACAGWDPIPRMVHVRSAIAAISLLWGKREGFLMWLGWNCTVSLKHLLLGDLMWQR